MLTELRVRDVAVIADVSLPLGPGLNVLTGETGAGKSMLVDALALLLGERASADCVRPGTHKAVVEAAFDVSRVPGVHGVAEEVGLDVEDDRIVVRREISTAGRNRAWANGSPASVAALGAVGQMLVDLHGQHEAQSLLRADAQRELLDAFADAGSERRRVVDAFATAQALRSEEATLRERREDVRRRADYLRHVAQEVEGAKPKQGEDETLELEARRLANAEELTELALRVASLVDGGEEHDVLVLLGAVARALAQLERLDESTTKWRELLESAEANLTELELAARSYASEIEGDPERLAQVERRRDLLFRLKQKYGPTIDEVLATAEQSSRELDLLDTADGDLDALAERRATAEAELSEAASALTAKRRKAAARMAKGVEKLFPGLGMPHGKFSVSLSPRDAIGVHGGDEVSFVVQLNPGMDARPLHHVASGGEMSRVMLALKVVLADHDEVPTLVFDEVDQGIGGEVAVQVGEALERVAQKRQVLVITHLPQIAARAAHHVSIAKRAKGGIATSDVTVLAGTERTEEIARMLGDADDPTALRHANEMLKRGGVTAKV